MWLKVAMALFSVEVIVRCYHAHEDIWFVVLGEELLCQHESNNLSDPFAVAVIKGGNVVGYVPKISSLYSLYLHQGGSILFHVTGYKHCLEDLAQGGLKFHAC